MSEARLPLLVHLTSYAFTPRSHPGIHRQVLGLAPAFRSLVLCGDRAPYHAEPLSEAERAAHRDLGIESRELVFQRLRTNLPILLGVADDRVLPAEKWLLQQGHFFEGARQLYEAGGPKALAQLWKKTRKDGGPLPRASLMAEYPVVGTWLAGIPAEVEIP